MMEDTDTLIALVSSLLSSSRSQDEILDALVRNEGDVGRAAEVLNASGSASGASGNGKRRREDGLAGWLGQGQGQSQSKKPKSSSASDKKPATVNLLDVLKQSPTKSSKTPGPKKYPPLTLSNSSMIASHTPTTLHTSVLPPELACTLFHTMIRASTSWSRNKWWLFDRLVESPHLTSFWARKTDGVAEGEGWHEAAKFWYNGQRRDPPKEFPDEMEEACRIVEQVVNDEMRKRRRYPLEWGGTRAYLDRKNGKSGGEEEEDYMWRANVAASNRYTGKDESVGFHSDQPTYLGPYATIASLSLGVRRNFSLREVIPTSEKETRAARTYNIPLPHNSLTIMHASCQERFKHAIPPQSAIDLFHPPFPPSTPHDEREDVTTTRINITFRFYRPDFRPESIPECRCGLPMVLRPDMKGRPVGEVSGKSKGADDEEGETIKYWWTCYSAAQNEGKTCGMWQVLDMEKEGRGPCVKDLK